MRQIRFFIFFLFACCGFFALYAVQEQTGLLTQQAMMVFIVLLVLTALSAMLAWNTLFAKPKQNHWPGGPPATP